MYLFLNHFAFIEPKSDLIVSDIYEALENLAKLFNQLNDMNIDIIIHQSLSQSILINKPIREYIKGIDNRNNRLSILSLLAKIKPICSDIDTPYEDDENIILANCLEKEGKIDVLQTFLSCAMYYNDPILTVNTLCNKAQFLDETINIICDDNNSYTLDNYMLIPYLDVINKIKKYQEKNLIDKYNLIDNWNDYKIFINEHYKYSKITDHFIKMLKKNHSYSNSHSVDLRNKVKRINELILLKGEKPKQVDFNELSKKHYSPESTTRFNNLKDSHSGILNYKNININLNWHTWVQDYRVYFEKEDDYISFVHYEKKIT